MFCFKNGLSRASFSCQREKIKMPCVPKQMSYEREKILGNSANHLLGCHYFMSGLSTSHILPTCRATVTGHRWKRYKFSQQRHQALELHHVLRRKEKGWGGPDKDNNHQQQAAENPPNHQSLNLFPCLMSTIFVSAEPPTDSAHWTQIELFLLSGGKDIQICQLDDSLTQCKGWFLRKKWSDAFM